MTPRGSSSLSLIQGLTYKQLKVSFINPIMIHLPSTIFLALTVLYPWTQNHSEIESLPLKRHSEARKSKQNVLNVCNFNHNPYSTLNRIECFLMEK